MPRFHQRALFRNTLRLILCAGLAIAPAANASAPSQPVAGPVRALHLTVELLPLHDSIQPGGNTLIGLHFTLDKGWHVYWINAGDSGEPPTIKWTLPAGITAGAMQFPAPRRLPLGPLMDFGYEDEVLFPITLSADSTLKAPSAAPLAAHVNWLVCREVCIPGKAELQRDAFVIDHPMKDVSIVVSASRKRTKVLDCFWCVALIELEMDVAI